MFGPRFTKYLALILFTHKNVPTHSLRVTRLLIPIILLKATLDASQFKSRRFFFLLFIVSFRFGFCFWHFFFFYLGSHASPYNQFMRDWIKHNSNCSTYVRCAFPHLQLSLWSKVDCFYSRDKPHKKVTSKNELNSNLVIPILSFAWERQYYLQQMHFSVVNHLF